jgi:putative SOS response-associated peptidase YedK
MCFHNSLVTEATKLRKRYKTKPTDTKEIKPIFHANAFDFQPWPVITDSMPDTIQFFQWGLIPAWTKSHEDALKMRTNTLNARIETVFEKPSFKEAIQKRHCIVPSTGFFEWQTVDGKKYPYFIRLKNEEIFSMAGIWETYKDPKTNELIQSFSILTTEANPLMATIHNSKRRMPVILSQEAEQEWLKNGFSEKDLAVFAKPFNENEMLAFTVGKTISEKNSNIPDVQKPFQYSIFNQTSLF